MQLACPATDPETAGSLHDSSFFPWDSEETLGPEALRRSPKVCDFAATSDVPLCLMPEVTSRD